MKLRILNFGIPATNDRIIKLENPFHPTSVSDFDAFVFDPNFAVSFLTKGSTPQPGTGGFNIQHADRTRELIVEKQQQVSELLRIKAGIVMCLLRENDCNITLQCQGGKFKSRYDKYFFLADLNLPISIIKPGLGTAYEIAQTAPAAGRKYFSTLTGYLQFHAHFSTDPENVRVIARDSVGHVIAAQFNVDSGHVVFLPVPHTLSGDRIGAAISDTVSALLRGEQNAEEPEWAEKILVPGADSHDGQIATLRAQQKQIKQELADLESKRNELLQFRHLLFGTGKGVLEPVVRSAFRSLGFEVPEPEEFSGEWDVELRLADGRTAIGEIEGAEGLVDVQKFRQLLHRVNDEILAGRNHKGVLIGNGFRREDPATRPEQFSPHVIEAAKKFSFCLVPATELFKCVTAVLEKPADENLREAARNTTAALPGRRSTPSAQDSKNPPPLSSASS